LKGKYDTIREYYLEKEGEKPILSKERGRQRFLTTMRKRYFQKRKAGCGKEKVEGKLGGIQTHY